MYIYTVQAMPGQKAKFEGDTSIKYQIKRVNTSIPDKGKGRTEIIRTNLEYDAATAMIQNFNSMEGKSQIIRDEEAERKKAVEYLSSDNSFRSSQRINTSQRSRDMSRNKQQDESNQEPKQEDRSTEPVEGKTDDQTSLPLYLRGTSEGNKGDTQDEKDEMGE